MLYPSQEVGSSWWFTSTIPVTRSGFELGVHWYCTRHRKWAQAGGSLVQYPSREVGLSWEFTGTVPVTGSGSLVLVLDADGGE